MRNLIFSALLLASAFQSAVGAVEGQWIYIVENGGATITASTATGAVTIPSELGGYAVKKVGDGRLPPIFGWSSGGGFNTSLRSVVIPNSVTCIWDNAFYGCSSLTSVTIGNNVTSIGINAFIGCNSLTSVTIPNSVTSIGAGAFCLCSSLASVTIGNNVTSIGAGAFEGCSSLTSVTIPNSVTSIGSDVFVKCTRLTSVTMPDRFIGQVAQIGISGQVATDYLVNALANNDAFVTAVANKIKATSGNYGIATQSGVTSSISSVINEGRIAGVASVTASPNTWSLFTTSQIQNMAVGDLVLTRQENGSFVLNYDIEQSTDLQTWTPYQALSLPLTGLPTDKAFVRIKVINSNPPAIPTTPPLPSPATPTSSNL